MTAEDRFVEKLSALLPEAERVLVGPGDDAAVFHVEAGEVVATTDLLVEGVDFLPDTAPEAIGRRALAVNLSDLAAMGARPETFLLTIGFPAEKGEEFPLAVARGALSRAECWKASLVGGDLSDAPVVVVSVALWGRAERSPLLRSGGKPGDDLYLSGFPGRAAAGLALASRKGPASLDARHARELLAAYEDPEPRVALGLELSRRGLAAAAIDVSDGVGIDAGRLARASGVRVVIEEKELPLSPALAEAAAALGTDPSAWMLAGGDDYELLFSARPESTDAIAKLSTAEVPVTRIGRLEEGEGAFGVGAGGLRDVSRSGWDHFGRRR
ncbi:MAG TPA: thiamine-phosphate kinase [Thermoanaerobaculia bacterium]|nr:thiamine-phosphate kinase [Thermoanaerobaculia bacterium]